MLDVLDERSVPADRHWPAGIRPLRAADLDGVAALQEDVLRPERPRPHAVVRDHLRRTFLEQPWAEPDLMPSLVAEHDGEIVGFLGSNPRRMNLDGRPLRVACSSGLVVRPDHRTRAAGALLIRTYLDGPQDLTMADCATETMRRLWTALRGSTLVHSSIGWTVPFEPLALATGMGVARARPRVASAMRAAGGVVRAVTPHLPLVRDRLVPSVSPLAGEPLTPNDLVEQVAATRSLRLRPAYDSAHLGWLFDEIAAVDERALLVRRLLRSAEGRVAGWYVYLLPYRGIAQVLAAHATAGDVEPVLDHLLRDAWERGAVAVQGRVEAAQAGFLASRRCLLRHTVWTLVATADPPLLAVLGTPQSLLSRLDGEWWIGHHLWRDE